MNSIPLTDALRQIAAGGTVADEALPSITWEEFGAAEQTARKAWLELCQWVSDQDIRLKDPAYERDKRGRLAWLLEEIEATRTRG